MTTSKNTTDLSRKRATYNIPYPSTEQSIDKNTAPNTSIHNQKVSFENAKKNYLKKLNFSHCQFFHEESAEKNMVEETTFQDCIFTSCFIGSVSFKYVRFENCQFSMVDFSRTKFENCAFEECVFLKVSCYNGYFTNTEIDSEAFLNGITLFRNHYETKDFDLATHLEFFKNKYILSKALYFSNNSVDVNHLADKALYQLKKNDLEYTIKTFWYQVHTIEKSIDYNNLWRILFISLNLFFTNGGTSLKKLILVSIYFILIINLFFQFSNISDTNLQVIDCKNCLINYLSWIPRTLSIFLAFGYTFFKASNFYELCLLNFTAIIGLISYALLISLIIRKVYK